MNIIFSTSMYFTVTIQKSIVTDILRLLSYELAFLLTSFTLRAAVTIQKSVCVSLRVGIKNHEVRI